MTAISRSALHHRLVMLSTRQDFTGQEELLRALADQTRTFIQENKKVTSGSGKLRRETHTHLTSADPLEVMRGLLNITSHKGKLLDQIAGAAQKDPALMALIDAIPEMECDGMFAARVAQAGLAEYLDNYPTDGTTPPQVEPGNPYRSSGTVGFYVLAVAALTVRSIGNKLGVSFLAAPIQSWLLNKAQNMIDAWEVHAAAFAEYAKDHQVGEAHTAEYLKRLHYSEAERAHVPYSELSAGEGTITDQVRASSALGIRQYFSVTKAFQAADNFIAMASLATYVLHQDDGRRIYFENNVDMAVAHVQLKSREWTGIPVNREQVMREVQALREQGYRIMVYTNHMSHEDTLACMTHLSDLYPGIVAKDDLLYTPGLGMYPVGNLDGTLAEWKQHGVLPMTQRHILLPRSNREQARIVMNTMMAAGFEAGDDLYAFAEGTRLIVKASINHFARTTFDRFRQGLRSLTGSADAKVRMEVGMRPFDDGSFHGVMEYVAKGGKVAVLNVGFAGHARGIPKSFGDGFYQGILQGSPYLAYLTSPRTVDDFLAAHDVDVPDLQTEATRIAMGKRLSLETLGHLWHGNVSQLQAVFNANVATPEPRTIGLLQRVRQSRLALKTFLGPASNKRAA